MKVAVGEGLGFVVVVAAELVVLAEGLELRAQGSPTMFIHIIYFFEKF